MGTDVFYGYDDASLSSTTVKGDYTYAVVREGGAHLGVDSASAVVGQGYADYYHDYQCYETALSFNTVDLPDTDTIDSATCAIYPYAKNITTDFTVELRARDYGASIGTEDFVAGSALGGATLVATLSAPTTLQLNQYLDLTNVALPANVSKTGLTMLLFSSNRHRLGNTPNGNEYFNWRPVETSGTTYDPKLTVVHSAGASPANSMTVNL